MNENIDRSPSSEIVLNQALEAPLRVKLEEYKQRKDAAQERGTDAYENACCKYAILRMLLDTGSVMRLEAEAIAEMYFDPDRMWRKSFAVDQAWEVISGYNRDGGATIIGGTGFNGRVPPMNQRELLQQLSQQQPSQDPSEHGTKERLSKLFEIENSPPPSGTTDI